MARTWTLHDDTLAEIPGGPIPAWQFPLNNAGTVVYIASFSLPTVFSYDGVTLTDISGATFSSLAQASIRGICNFKGDIYVAYVNGSGQARVARWDGGQSWTNVYEPSDITIEAFSSSVGKFLGADANRMMLAISESASPFESYFVATTNGATWTRQTVGGGAVTDIRQNQVLGGPENGNNYGQMLAQYYDTVATKLKTIVHNSGNDWLALTSAGYNWNDRHIVGYWDERSFYEDRNGVVYDLEQSTDWGDSVAATGIPTSDGLSINEHQMFYIASDALMALVNHTSYLDQAYTWDAVTEQFIEDGTCAANQIYGFFRLGDHIYAITDGGDNDIQIFDGGIVTIPPSPYELTHSAGGIPGSILEVTP